MTSASSDHTDGHARAEYHRRAVGSWEIERRENARDVDAAAWDMLADGDVVWRLGWLRAVEAHHLGGLRTTYFLARRDGRAIASAVAHAYDARCPTFTPDHTLLRHFRKPASAAGLSFLPALVAGPLKGPGRHVRLDPALSGEEAAGVTESLVSAVEDQAARTGRATMWRDVMANEPLLTRILRARGYRFARTPATTALDLPPTFDGYVARLRSGSRNAAKAVRKELRRVASMNVTIRVVEDVSGRADELHALADEHYRRLNHKPFPYTAGLFLCLAKHLGDATRVFGAFRGDDLIGFSLDLMGRSTVHAFFVGVSDRDDESAVVYFPLNYYEPIRAAIGGGRRTFEFGKMSLEAKLRRGCRLEPTYLAYRSRHRVRNVFASAWFRAYARMIADDPPKALERRVP